MDTETTPTTESPNIGDALEDSIRPTVEALPDIAAQLWWLLLIVGAILIVKVLLFIRRERRLARTGIREIDAMSGPKFEQYLRTMFTRLGYRVEVVGSARGDYGGDLVIRKNGTKTIVQAKRYKGKKVGIKAVQEAHTARAMYDCAEAMVVTNSFFSQQAQKTARATGVQLWDRDELVRNLLKAEDAKSLPRPNPVEIALAPSNGAPVEPTTPEARCATCGEAVSEKVYAFCIADAERFGGLVYCFRHQRAFRRT